MEKIFDPHYQFLIDHFTLDKITNRFENTYLQILEVIDRFGLDPDDKFIVNESLLEEAILDYFTDIYRMKQFQQIEKANPQKIYAYSTYWFLRRKPVQIITSVADEFLYINEKIAICMLLSKMLSGFNLKPKDESDSIKNLINEFSDLLYYNLKFRAFSQQSLELMIEAFICGCLCFKPKEQ